ncbi:hypothetical protein HGH92_26575 [Chitinophaga varians]|uniref:Uncharacterized protein n=1 Tax=Chitinophaga varians TaxID=2202339 RepID=A0A847S469_9BACT|nr:hypothetical protein [Chitinophaga varians]NLR67898.1 hypothetical protein [Chitinophaga varians]
MRKPQKQAGMTIIVRILKNSFFFEQKHVKMLPAFIFLKGRYPYYRIHDILSKIETDKHSQEAVRELVIDTITKDTIIWRGEEKERKAKYRKDIKQPKPDRFGFI